MLLAVIALIPFILAVVLRGQPLKSMGWQKENLRAGLIVGLLHGYADAQTHQIHDNQTIRRVQSNVSIGKDQGTSQPFRFRPCRY